MCPGLAPTFRRAYWSEEDWSHIPLAGSGMVERIGRIGMPNWEAQVHNWAQAAGDTGNSVIVPSEDPFVDLGDSSP